MTEFHANTPSATEEARPARRRFLGAAATGAAGVAAMAAPMISVAQSPVVLKMQGAWGAKDIFNEMAEEYVKRVNEMSGGRLRIDYLVGGAVVKPFEVMDAVSSGVLDAGHQRAGVLVRQKQGRVAVRLRPDQRLRCAADAGLDLPRRRPGDVPGTAEEDSTWTWSATSRCRCRRSRSAGSKSRSSAADELKGLKYRTVGLAADLMQEMGVKVTQLPGGEIVPAMDRGVIEAFEFNNPTSDRRFGAQDVAKFYMMGSFHQAMEFFEIIFNKKKHDSLPKDLQAILRYAAEAASQSNWWTAMDNYSKDLDELITTDKVEVLRTPKSVFESAAQGLGRDHQEAVGRGPDVQEGGREPAGLVQARGQVHVPERGRLPVGYEHMSRQDSGACRPETPSRANHFNVKGGEQPPLFLRSSG